MIDRSVARRRFSRAAASYAGASRLEAEVGATIVLDQVLMVADGEAVKVGTPMLAGAKVSATVVSHGRGPKIRIFKMRRRKHYQKTQGHRQNYTEIRVDAINE